ncbi:hypothetical protein, partial [Salipiger sp. HF18]|uniref:hypothetical protein n=1 Tax=Salipiger sp. HF18 TaxID=2721557 RepID=UPI001C37D172
MTDQLEYGFQAELADHIFRIYHLSDGSYELEVDGARSGRCGTLEAARNSAAQFLESIEFAEHKYTQLLKPSMWKEFCYDPGPE